MNAPAPGWYSDPTTGHEYRYWNGTRWTDDVSDGGVTSVDPLPPGQSPGGFPSGDTTTAFPGGPADPYANLGPGPPSPSYGGASGSGQMPPGQPARKGPSTGQLVALVAVAVVLIAGLVYVATSGDGDEAADDTTTTTSSDGGDSTSTTSGGGDGGGGTDQSALVDAIATGFEDSTNGAITREQAECAAEGIVEQFGEEELIEIGLADSPDPFAELSPEQQTQVISTVLDCVPADVLAELGQNTGTT